MYVSDERALKFISLILLILLPGLGVWWTWGLIWDLLIIIALFTAGRHHKIGLVASVLVLGYGVPLIFFGFESISSMSFVPWAGLVALYGLKHLWPERKTLGWSLSLAGLLGALSMLPFYQPLMEETWIKELVATFLEQYETAGLLTSLQQQGMSSGQLSAALEQFFTIYFTISPALVALLGCFTLGLVYLFARRWFLPGRDKAIAFTRWQLPWHMVWFVILALAAYLLGSQLTWDWLISLGINLMVVFGTAALLLGISLYTYFLRSPKVPRLLKWITVFINIFYLLFSIVTLILFGIFDIVFNFRGLPGKTEESR